MEVDTDHTQSSVTLGNAEVAFPGGTVVKVESILSGSIFQRTEKALKDWVQSMDQTAVFEFTAVQDGREVQPTSPLQVVFAIPTRLSSDHLKMFYVTESGTTEEIPITVDKQANTVTANLRHFSTYVLVNVNHAQGETQVPATGDFAPILPASVVLLCSLGLLCTAVVWRKRVKN